MNTTRFIQHFTDTIAALRPDWHPAGIRAALRTSLNIRGPQRTAEAMLRRAANPNNLTPQLQPQDFVEPTVPCPAGRGAWPHGRCAGCREAAIEAPGFRFRRTTPVGFASDVAGEAAVPAVHGLAVGAEGGTSDTATGRTGPRPPTFVSTFAGRVTVTRDSVEGDIHPDIYQVLKNRLMGDA